MAPGSGSRCSAGVRAIRPFAVRALPNGSQRSVEAVVVCRSESSAVAGSIACTNSIAATTISTSAAMRQGSMMGCKGRRVHLGLHQPTLPEVLGRETALRWQALGKSVAASTSIHPCSPAGLGDSIHARGPA